MTLGDLLNLVRTCYLDRFRDALAECRSCGQHVIAEAAHVNRAGELVCEGDLQLPIRSDLVVISDGAATRTIQVDTAKMLSFEPLEFIRGSMSVGLWPFQWQWCSFTAHPELSSIATRSLAQWFMTWFSEREGDPGLVNAAHFLSDLDQSSASASSFVVDFGSAPIEAFEHLLDVCQRGGVTRLVIGRHDVVEHA